MKSNQLLAHPDQSLVQHLLGVARRAEEFAAHYEDGLHDAGLKLDHRELDTIL